MNVWWRGLVLAALVAAPRQRAAAEERPGPWNRNADLLVAVRGGDPATAIALLDRGADPNSRNRLGDTPVNTAARAGDVPLVKALLAHGADPNRANLAGVTPLMSAAHRGHAAI